jgi:hypothetical protein
LPGRIAVLLKRFVVAFVLFAGLVLSGAFALALLAAKAYPAPASVLSCTVNAASPDQMRALHTFAQVPWDK